MFPTVNTVDSSEESDNDEHDSRRTFTTDFNPRQTRQKLINWAEKRIFPRRVEDDLYSSDGMPVAMDQSINEVKAQFSMSNTVLSEVQLSWYAAQSFIGFQSCAFIAQHWLVEKACAMPGEDAVRKGYEVMVKDGEEQDIVKIREMIREFDVTFRVNYNLTQFVKFGRVFGIRIILFKVENGDDKYYEQPFNPDGITKGQYKGIAQIEPYWCTPELDMDAASDASSIHFYEPTWWRINGRRYHRTHLVIMRTEEVADILKPSYIYGGIPVPQKIYERVYAAERTANEAPELALTKRTTIFKTDLSKALADQAEFEKVMQERAYYRNNYANSTIDSEDDAMQFDTTLADLDAVIMTQYQIVAAAAGVPATKLLGTPPKGFNTTGEYEERSYHEKLESLQAHVLTELLDRHHLLLVRSEIAPAMGVAPFNVTVKWNPIATLTAEQQANVNKTKAETGALLVSSAAIDGQDERQRIIADKDSGYSGLSAELAESDPNEEDLTEEPEDPEVEREDNEYI